MKVWLLLLLYTSIENSVAGETVPPPYGMTRICTVSVINSSFFANGPNLRWHDFSCSMLSHSAAECPGFIGMTLTFKCQIEGTQVYSVQKGKSLRSAITINDLQQNDTGEYQCRSANDEVISAFNITVGDIAIGIQGSFCKNILYDSTHSCYEIKEPALVTPMTATTTLGHKFFLFGTSNVSMHHHWITSINNHYPTDVGLVPSWSDSTTLQISITKVPKGIVVHPTILAIVSASNGLTTYSTCLKITFNVQDFTTNESLPLDVTTTEGRNATFECVLGTFHPGDSSDRFYFQYTHTLPGNNVLNKSCSTNLLPQCLNTEENTDGYTIHVTPIKQHELRFLEYRVTLWVLNVGVEHNRSAFSCAIWSSNQTQWLNTGYLYVEPQSLQTTAEGTVLTRDSTSYKEPLENTVVVVSVVMVIVVGIGTMIITGSILLVRRKQKKRERRVDPDQVPLVPLTAPTLNLSDSKASTRIMGDESGTRGPAIQISDYGDGLVNGLFTTSAISCDGDQGYHSSSQSCNDLSIGCQLVSQDERTPPTTLGVQSNPAQLSRSDSDLINSHSKEGTINTDFFCHKKCVVYISYTERMARWVREWLKPLIESWQYSEVILHEDDMIPGFTIPEERQRLILEADKVVLVVSRDYSESPWCLYELQHAIQQEPALCRGRIIPVLVDDCQILPSIVRGVVPLMENDRNFSYRLRRNILGH